MGFQFNPPLLIAHLSSAFPVTMPFGFLFLLKNPTGPEKQKHFSGFFLLQKKNSRGSQFSGLCWILELDSVIFRLGFKEIWCEGFRATKLCAAMVCGCFSVLKWRKEERASSSSLQEQDFWVSIEFQNQSLGIINNVRLFSYNSLRSATRNFHPSSRIGGGGYGVVYRGILRDDAQVAIKCLSAESRQGANEFLTEINVISRIRHPNLVELLGCCVEDNHRILVYEYLENNSLSKSLLGSRSKYVFLDWPTRVSICLGTATGLAFLHEEAEQQIVHRDIKASNILLDANFRPKIGDFGLAKLFPDNVTHLSTRVAGTEGYLAPEYALLGQLTKKADVYSFGVLLLEIISGRSSSKAAFGEQLLVLVEWVWKLREEERLLELVDPELTAYPEAEVMRFIKVALFCTQATAQQRPTMKQVVEMLSKEVHLNEKALTKPRPRMHASGKFGGTSSLEETSSSSHSEKRKKSTANPDVTSTSSLIFDDSETQILPR